MAYQKQQKQIKGRDGTEFVEGQRLIYCFSYTWSSLYVEL